MPSCIYLSGRPKKTKLLVAVALPVIESLSKVEVSKQTTQEDKQWTKLGYQVPIIKSHKRPNVFLIFIFLIKTDKWTICSGVDATQHRQAIGTTLNLMLDLCSTISITQHIMHMRNVSARALARISCKSQCIKIRHRPLHLK